MQNFIATTFKFQQAAFQATASVTSLMMETYLRFLKQQFPLLGYMHAYRRPDDPYVASTAPKAKKVKGRKAGLPCCGPDLHDHYGKRAHDIDVEHI
ncbi:MAG: hypothetical protein HQ494_05715 [Rhodospirillales bacterium]|nr:hypothetical protein [Rhodospirillales bacterium]